MEAKLKIAEYDCYKRSFFEKVKKEESRDAVVPDTMPDIAEVLCCRGSLLIRSKDLSPGRIRVEANVPAAVLCRGEDGSLRQIEVSVPVFLSVENENIAEGAAATAMMKLLNLEARTLNPRKILVRAEIGAEIAAYEADKFCCTEGTEGEEHIHAHSLGCEVSLISAVTEKTFALTSELSLPPAAEGVKEVFCADTQCVVDEVKNVGTKLIVKGRVKSALIMLTSDGGLCHLEPVTDFSQIIELGKEAGEGLYRVWLIPSGAYCSLSGDSEGRLSLEYHLVAQALCHGRKKLQLMDDAYSNLYVLESEYTQPEMECLEPLSPCRESLRQLFETLRPVGEVLWCSCSHGEAAFDGDKMLLPLNVLALCSAGDELWCERRSLDVAFRMPRSGSELKLKSAEITDCAMLPVPGGLELRLEAVAEVYARESVAARFVSALSYDEEAPINNSAKPSLVLLRLKAGQELWNLARDNCSALESILAANSISDASEAVGKLILIPKTS